jgi:Cd2+-exporting ATPase
MVSKAKFSKPKTQEIADQVAGYFVPIILAITVTVFVIWVVISKAVQKRSTTNTVVNALTYTLSALIVSCPCAIGLAVPMVVIVAGGIAAKKSLVFRVGETNTSARKVTPVIFDKTGTLTQGKTTVVSEICLSGLAPTARAITLALTKESKHPIFAAIATYLSERGVGQFVFSETNSIVSKGLEGTLTATNLRVRGGNITWIDAEDNQEVQRLLSQNLTVFCVRLGSTLIAAYGLQDNLRTDARQVISQLQDRGIQISIVSGDEDNAVRAVAHQSDIPAMNIRSRCSPADKKKFAEDITTFSVKPPSTLSIGDGTNDAPALAQASIDVHVSDGTEVAKSASDLVLLTPSLQ